MRSIASAARHLLHAHNHFIDPILQLAKLAHVHEPQDTHSVVYCLLPIGDYSTSWFSFFGWIAAVSLAYDFWFFCAHKWFHENANRYKFFHKLHHLVKDPNPFSAYFVTMQSHFATSSACLGGSVASSGYPSTEVAKACHAITILERVCSRLSVYSRPRHCA